ncbi:MAG: hypothetical protein K9G64_04760 [Bacteroidia bacterium]|nr:hypothetical protein [Bacteroidia bacterium]
MAWFFILPSSVWLIYFFDHLLDTLKTNAVISERHALIEKHQFVFKIIAAIIIVINAILVIKFFSFYHLTKSIWIVLTCIIYFLLNFLKIKWFVKEFFAAIIYAGGICFYPYVVNENNFFSQIFITAFCMQLFVLALINLLQISIRETNTDKDLQVKNISNVIGQKLSNLLLIALYFLAGFMLFKFQFSTSLTIGFMSCFAIHLLHFTKLTNKKYRLITEFSFMLIGVIYLIGKF